MFFTQTAKGRISTSDQGIVGDNLYRQWLEDRRSCRPLPHDQSALTSDDVSAVERWAHQVGWCVALRHDIGGRPQMIELFGPEFGEPADPIGLVYRTEHGFQVDEWIGRSWQLPTLNKALTVAASRL